MAKHFKYPKDISEAKNVCIELCNQFSVSIDFDDKWKNFWPDIEKCVCSKDRIECAVFRDWNYDLLPFAVMHELGHLNTDYDYIKDKNNFIVEFDAWNYAIGLFVKTFNRNIGIKQAKYMMKCLSSYVPDYNDFTATKDGLKEHENRFWCPIKKRVLK